MIHLRNRWTALFLALVLSLSLALPASAAQEDRAQAAHEAAQYAMQYGGAVSVQYALWENGEVTLQGHDGVYSKTENRALTDDDLYGIGSISKTYTAAAMMKLVEQGKVDLDEPVTAYLPDFTMADPRYTQITVRMLLNHSSGLMGGTTNDAFLFGDQGNDDAPSRLLERLAGQTLQAEPGAYSVYSNDSFTLAQLVIERVSGMEYTAFLNQYLLEPLGLENTLTPMEEFDTSRLVKTYLGTDTRALPAENLTIVGTGGIYSTASDLAAFGGALCGEGLLSQASLDEMASDQYLLGMWPEDSDGDAVAYGLGWDSVHMFPFSQNGIQALVKGGDTIVYHAGLVILPEYDMAAAVLTSGGISTYNQLAAARILLDALAEQGVEVEEEAALTPAQPAQMPAEVAAACRADPAQRLVRHLHRRRPAPDHRRGRAHPYRDGGDLHLPGGRQFPGRERFRPAQAGPGGQRGDLPLSEELRLHSRPDHPLCGLLRHGAPAQLPAGRGHSGRLGG